jgi:hypothetical protein
VRACTSHAADRRGSSTMSKNTNCPKIAPMIPGRMNSKKNDVLVGNGMGGNAVPPPTGWCDSFPLRRH